MALPTQTEDFPAWYQEVVKQADLAENSLARGTMVIKPYGYAIWEAIRDALDERIKATGHQNMYFPMLIPSSLLEREAEHVEGFAPEVAVVTHAGGEDLAEPLVVRPTSETIIWDAYSRWIQSYRDLPFLYNQWANVIRWEMRPRLFLRTTEFLWQEGHTAHETREEAEAEARMILLDVYRDVAERVMAMPVRTGRKSAAERFAGAVETLTIEALMRDGKALQAGTSHYLGQNFARAYGVSFLGRDGEQHLAEATSWGVSTRLVGGLIMTHGDDRGLRLPPLVAPIQTVIVPIPGKDGGTEVLETAAKLEAGVREAGVRTRLDDRTEQRPGFKFAEWELKGVPVRIELGARDLAAGVATVVRRDGTDKVQVSLDQVPARVLEALTEVQEALFRDAVRFAEEHTSTASTYDEVKARLADPGGFVTGPWCRDPSCEATVKDDTKATIRYLPLDPGEAQGGCVVCGRPATETATWAQAY